MSNPLQELVDAIGKKFNCKEIRLAKSRYYRVYIVHTNVSLDEVVTTYYGDNWEDIWNQLCEEEDEE